MQSVFLFYLLIITEQWKRLQRATGGFTVKIPIGSSINHLQEKPGIQFFKCFSTFLLISFRPDARRGSPPPQFPRWEAWLLPPPTPREWAGCKYLPLLLTQGLWREQPLLIPATCPMMTAAHSPVYSRAALPLPAVCNCTCEGNVLPQKQYD